MTAGEIFELRTGQPQGGYVELAEYDVREYLRYDEGESLDRFASTVGNIAVLYYQRDEAVKAMPGTAGVKSESFTEGKVSEKTEYLTAADMADLYDKKAADLMAGIARYRRARVPEAAKDADKG